MSNKADELREIEDMVLMYMTGMGVVAGIDEPDGQFQVPNEKFAKDIAVKLKAHQDQLLRELLDELPEKEAVTAVDDDWYENEYQTVKGYNTAISQVTATIKSKLVREK